LVEDRRIEKKEGEMIVEPLEVIMRTAFPNRTLDPGFLRDEIAAVEAHLKVTFPEALKDYLAVCGKTRELMDTSYRLYSPDQLRVEDGHLIFCAEKDGTAEYGIPVRKLEDLGATIRPSVNAKKKNAEKWFSESGSISAFLLGVGSFQAVRSAMEQARFKLPEKRLKEVVKFFEPVGEPEVRLGGHIIGLIDREHSIVAVYLHLSERLLVGSSGAGEVKAFAERSGFKLEWATYQTSEQTSVGPRMARSKKSGDEMIVEPLQLILRTAFPNRAFDHGFSRNEIAAAEARLNVPLPEALKDYLAVCGKTREMMDKNYHLYSLDDLRVEDDHLIFCEENQGIEEYGVPLQDLKELGDFHPRVQAKSMNTDEWRSESGSISAFLLGVGSFQAVLSMDNSARFELPEKRLKKIEKFFEPVGDAEARSGSQMVGFVDRRHFIVATYMHNPNLYDPETLWVASSADGALEAFEEHSGFELDWL
jgi:cell wall assembly regulator SMI1